MSRTALTARYALFAAIATAVNLATQHASLLMLGASLLAAMAAGTATGLLAKYVLDKRWIFHDRSPARSRQLTLYAATGVLTTAVFWGAELTFAKLFAAPYLGAVLGLSAGYATKYRLDRRFVFPPA